MHFYVADFFLFSYAVLRRLFSLKAETCSKKANSVGIVIGNGPSLKKDIYNIRTQLDSSDLYCVNYFALDDIFLQLQPRFYFLADPLFWRSDTNELMASDRDLLLNKLQQVDWDMNIICPQAGKKLVAESLASNKFIKVSGIPNLGCNFHSEKLSLTSYKLRIATPVFGNVLILALWHAVKNRHQRILLYGADFSMFKELYIDQITNELTSSPPHFYKNTPAQNNVASKYTNAPKKKLHTRLLQAYKGFKQMHLISLYAKLIGVSIVNKSSFSYLDMFERK